MKTPINKPDSMMSLNPFRCKSTICLIAGVLCLISGLVLIFLLDVLVHKILARKLVIVEGQEGYKFWKDPPANIHRKMYIWHCSNPCKLNLTIK
ncbi:unnamed protein product [Didymodactylos carnosus]|uniref:Uncharacterized protein n=1 Tax=Didymodactylos carnosus TaxID=1234261 RepID=A0A8S2RLN1_9BILA|nr:unnamed protein product [Didymodactylos carnosus]CAF4168509.1 unnamed protein product [Didymodactylos carnosus]